MRLVRSTYKVLSRVFKWAAAHQFRLNHVDQTTKVMIDNTILDLAIAHETRWVSMGEDPFDPRPELGGYLARVPVHDPSNRGERYNQLKYLSTFSILAREGYFNLVQSSVLRAEQLYQPVGRFRGYGLFDKSLLEGVVIENVGENFFPTLAPSYFNLPSAKEQLRQYIENIQDDKFQNFLKAMKSHFGQKCSQDARHIWLAEENEVPYFLTTDSKLVSGWEQIRNKAPIRDMRVEVHTPQSLGEKLDYKAIPPIVFSYDDNDALIRTDVVMPGQKRRPRSRYRSD